jgi:tryptophan synthase beta chain
MTQERYTLTEREIPKSWYNVIPDLPAPLPPPLHPGTGQPASPDDLTRIFPIELIEQEVSGTRTVPIPEPVLDVFRLWRPTPLCRARRLEKTLGTPASIFYKHEGISPAGSHKPNTSVAQAYYNKPRASNAWRRRQGLGSGEAPWPMPVMSSVSSAWSTW